MLSLANVTRFKEPRIIWGSLCGLNFLYLQYMSEGGGQLLRTCDDDRLLHIIAGVKRLLMKLKSREIYSGTWLQSSQ